MSKNRRMDSGKEKEDLRVTKDMSAKHGDPLVHYLEDGDPEDQHQTLSSLSDYVKQDNIFVLREDRWRRSERMLR